MWVLEAEKRQDELQYLHTLHGILLGNGALPEGFPGEVHGQHIIMVAIWRDLGPTGTDVQRCGKLVKMMVGAAAAVGFAYMQHNCCNTYLTAPVGNIVPVCEIYELMYIHTGMAQLYASAGVKRTVRGE